jgi:hypothetical protein
MKVIISIKHIQVAFLYIRTLTWKIQLKIIARQWQIEYISPFAGIELTTLVVICTGCISNYYTTTTTTVGLCYYFQEWY